MAFTHTITRGYRDSSGITVQSTETVSSDSERNFDASIATSTTKMELDLALTLANIKSMSIYSDKVLEVIAQDASSKAVEGVTNTNATDAQINITAHGYSVGQRIHITAIGGATNLNGFFYVKTVVDADHFKFSTTSGGSPVQGNGASYTSGGIVQKLTTLNLVAGQNQIFNSGISTDSLFFAYNTDVFYITNASSTDAAALKIRVLADQTP